MVLEGLRGYLQLANGLTDVTRERARATARQLLAQGEAGLATVLPESVKTQVGSLTEDLLATSRANRTLMVNLVRAEVERAMVRLGPVLNRDVEQAVRRLGRLEDRVAVLERQVRSTPPAPTAPTAPAAPTKRSSTRPSARTSTRSGTATKSAVTKTAATKTAATKTAATKTAAAKTAAAKTAAAKKVP